MEAIYEGKAKRMWTTDNPDTLRMEFKNDATAFNGEKKASFENKGRLNNAISTLIYGMLEKEGVPTHFVRKIDDTNVEVRKVDILMVEVIVRNLAAGSFCKRTGMPEGHVFSQPIIEFSYKSDALGDPLINDDYIREMKLASRKTSPTCASPRSRSTRSCRDFSANAGSGWWTSSWSSAAWCQIPRSSCWRMKSARTAAACGTSRPARKWTRTASAAISAT
jgi:phosphoribosylaminoimidazole-succinocarboxamide synthase